MRGGEGQSSSRISPTSLSVKTVFFLSLGLLLRLTVTHIISEAMSALWFLCLGKIPHSETTGQFVETNRAAVTLSTSVSLCSATYFY